MGRKTATSVLVGLSGGVDSSLAAALLQRRGFRVSGGFIKNWSDTKEVATGECAWKGERRDALRTAAKLGIPLLTFDFEKAYRNKIVAGLFKGYAAGITPNPDVLCNEVIKFGLFVSAARKLGFDYVATGHYVRLRRDKSGAAHLLRGVDADKDQSYFLYRVPQNALRMAMFPVGGLKKSRVRELARRFKLPVADKPDSQGICFIGKLDMVKFLRQKIKSRPGAIVDDRGNVIGRHQGLDAYTIGQRQRIGIARGRKPWFVADKIMATNTLLVVPGQNHPRLYRSQTVIGDVHWVQGRPPRLPLKCEVQVRYRQAPVKAMVRRSGKRGRRSLEMTIEFSHPVKAVAPGQSAVIYRGRECLGGGVIRDT